ncbi:hypothetical protein [Phormidium sp. CCY1219]|uniref:hypothetical protein n=1 Tax=Phormidium sp. CCY1219 TaxID=2886104 RepID=UPI002D1EB447|nr:hypothetical protein [Phormidium sp. CCY1219]MEB3828703.1 hypothetical protein [Phormidium sp. CCY1219]
MQNIQPSFQALRENLHQRHWQEWAEWTSVGVSAVGTFVAALSGQVVYAAAPLTLALSLNLASRSRFKHQHGQETSAQIADLRQVVNGLYAAREEKPVAPPVDLDPFKDELTQLRNLTQRLENNAVREDEWETVNVRLLLLQEQIAKLWETLEGGPTSIPTESVDDNANLPSNFSDVQEAIAQLSHNFSHLQTEVQAIASGRESTGDRLSPELEPLLARVARLEQHNKKIIKPYLQRLTGMVKKLENSHSLSAVKEKLDGLSSQMEGHPERHQIEELQRELGLATAGLSQLEHRFEALSPQTDAEQLSSLEAAIAELFEKVNALHGQMQRRLSSLEHGEIERLHKEIDLHSHTIVNLEEHYDELLNLVNQLGDRLENLPPPARIELLGDELVRLSEAIAQMQKEIGLLPASSKTEFEQQIEELKTAIANLERNNLKYVTKKDLLPLVLSLKKLGQHKLNS